MSFMFHPYPYADPNAVNKVNIPEYGIDIMYAVGGCVDNIGDVRKSYQQAKSVISYALIHSDEYVVMFP